MKITSKVIEDSSTAVEKVKFPRVMIHNNGVLIVCFTSDTQGFSLSRDEYASPLLEMDIWNNCFDATMWTPFKGKIEITIE